jgi:lysophospholipase L1-like esterase
MLVLGAVLLLAMIGCGGAGTETAVLYPGGFSATPAYSACPAGEKAVLKVVAGSQLGSAANVVVSMSASSGTASKTAWIRLDEQGTADYSFDTTGLPTGLWKLTLLSSELSANGTAHVDVLPRKKWDEFNAAAQQASPGTLPAHYLFLGDGLTDFSRGFNYVDQVAYWLQRTHGGQFSFRNAGEGGDFITRVWQRLNESPKAYRLDAYNGLFDPPPTRIFIFLGHNDSKLTSGSGFTLPMVSLEDFETTYAKVVQRLKSQTGAPVTVVSSTSSVYEITLPLAEQLLAQRGTASLFGKPEMLERFNTLAHKVALENGCDYVDVYEPTRSHPDKRTLFTSDGVHLTVEGNHLIALELLKYLGKR